MLRAEAVGRVQPVPPWPYSVHGASWAAADGEELLVVQGCTVTARPAGCAARKSVTVDTPVIQALWVCFELQGAGPSALPLLCVVERASLTLFAATGAVFTVVAPCVLVRAHALPRGILVAGLDPGAGECLLYLSHPVAALRPVLRAVSSLLADGNSALVAERRHLLAAQTLNPEGTVLVLVLFDAILRSHSVAVAVPAVLDEDADAGTENADTLGTMGLLLPTLRTTDLWVDDTREHTAASRAFATAPPPSPSPPKGDAALCTLSLLLQCPNVLVSLVVRGHIGDAAKNTDTMLACAVECVVPAMDAVPLRALAPRPFMQLSVQQQLPGEILILEPLQRLGLYSHGERVAGVMVLADVTAAATTHDIFFADMAAASAVPVPAPPPLVDVTARIRALFHPVEMRFTVQFDVSDATLANTELRCALSLAPHTPALSVCLDALQGLGCECLHGQALLLHLRRLYLPLAGTTPGGELAAFAAACDRLVGLCASPAVSVVDDWQFLLASTEFRGEFGRVHDTLPDPVPPRSYSLIGNDDTDDDDTALARQHAHCLVWALHAGFENARCNVLLHKILPELAGLVGRLAAAVGWWDFVDHYARHCPSVNWAQDVLPTASTSGPVQCPWGFALPPTPIVPNIVDWLAAALHGKLLPAPYPTLGLQPATALCSLFAHLAGCPTAVAVVDAMVEAGIDLDAIECLPAGMALPLREAIHRCRHSPPRSWGPAACRLVGRLDLAVHAQQQQHHEQQHADTIWGRSNASDDAAPTAPNDSDGMHMASDVPYLRFGGDTRLQEVRRLFNSSRAARILVERTLDMSDHDILHAEAARLQLVVQRTLSLSVGRGMFTLNTVQPVVTESVSIPKLVLDGRGAGNNTITFGDGTLSSDATTWPTFHNGVAAGLRLTRASHVQVATAWIAYHRSSVGTSDRHGHAGFLMAMGLLGHLASAPDLTIYSYLHRMDPPTSVGLLLGLAASRCGTMDAFVARALGMHVQGMLPRGATAVAVAPLTATAALVGVGLLYQGSGHRLAAETMLHEIGGHGTQTATPGTLPMREGHCLAAGLALGMVLLGRGQGGLTDLRLPEQLRLHCDGGLLPTVATEPLLDPMQAFEPVPPHRPTRVNNGVTCPGATLALGLMFLRTHDPAIAAQLALPNTPVN